MVEADRPGLFLHSLNYCADTERFQVPDSGADRLHRAATVSGNKQESGEIFCLEHFVLK